MRNRFVFDTNSLISAALSPHSTNAQALRHAEFLGEVVFSNVTWNEFVNVLFRAKFDKYFTIEERKEIATRFMIRFRHIHVSIIITEYRDEKDNMFLELAVTSTATCIITGDKDLLVLNPFRNIPILNATDFLNQF